MDQEIWLYLSKELQPEKLHYIIEMHHSAYLQAAKFQKIIIGGEKISCRLIL